MKLEDQVTSLELSNKLKELGFKQKSLFYWILNACKRRPNNRNKIGSTIMTNIKDVANIKLAELIKQGGKGFIRDPSNKIALIRCPKCHQENYAMNVIHGLCTWCEFDANE